ncbi:MAG: hypothetical protein AAF772_02020 [Acidobacteriota bacterium]
MISGHRRDVARLMRALDQELRGRGRGALAAMQRELGYTKGWWQGRVTAGDITIGQLLGVLGHLGLDPTKFVRRVLGDDDGFELDRPPGAPPALVARAWARLRGGAEGGVGMGLLDTLDQERYEAPAEALDVARWAVDHVELALLPRLLGVAGAAWRRMIRLDEAAHAIRAGIEMAQLADDRAEIGKLLRRLAYVAADRGDRGEALRISEHAGMVLLRCGDAEFFGKALTDQGTWLYYLERFHESICTLELALLKLPSAPSRSRGQALQCIGACHRDLGNTELASEFVGQAFQCVSDRNTVFKGKLLWLHARILSDLGELEQAAHVLQDVVDVFRTLHHGEAALATCELVCIQLMLGQPREAFNVAASMRALMEPLHANQVISTAIADLLRTGQAGLTLALAEEVKARIADERQNQQNWRALDAGFAVLCQPQLSMIGPIQDGSMRGTT